MALIVAAALLALAVVLYVLAPILQGRGARAREWGAEPSEAEARKRVALLALRDVEHDYATGKLDEADYRRLKNEISGEALRAIRREQRELATWRASDGKAAAGTEPTEVESGAEPDSLEREIAAARARLHGGLTCGQCGHANRPGSKFCATCGHPLSKDALGAGKGQGEAHEPG